MRPGLDQRTATANVLSWSIVWKDAYLSFCSPLRSAPIALVEAIMKAKPHPEQGFRSCLGIISLVRTYGSERVEAASRRGNDIGATTYGSIKSILQNGLDKAYANSKAPDGPPNGTPTSVEAPWQDRASFRSRAGSTRRHSTTAFHHQTLQ